MWVSEIMLQQTRVDAVVPRFGRFIARFPDVAALAQAEPDDVLSLWSGLGYYARARNLHAAARAVVAEHGGRFPGTLEGLTGLPGIGRSTAGAILSLAFRKPFPILDGNAKRVLARCFGVEGPPKEHSATRRLWEIAGREQPARAPHLYTQGIMDLGALVCTPRAPACEKCPVAGRCLALKAGTQDRLPASSGRPSRRELPVTFVVAVCGGSVLLARRPDGGYWGGLWTPLEFGSLREWEDFRERRLGKSVTPLGAMGEVRAEFSHLRLRISPILVAAKRRFRLEGARWIGPGELSEVGVPAPVSGLLRSIDGFRERRD